MEKTLFLNKTNLTAFKDLLREIDLSKNTIIVVPDKFTLSAESMFFDEKNILSTFSTRVFSLTKLASLVLKQSLGDKEIIDKNISLMICSSIISENLHKLKYFKNIKDINHITIDIFNVISQMLSSNISEFDENQTTGFKNKLEDFKLIFDLYKQKRENYLVDSSKKYELFLENIKNSDFLRDKIVCFAMFDSMTNQVKDIIREISLYAKGVMFCTSKTENRINNNDIFEFYKSFKPKIKVGESKLNETSEFILNNFFSLNKTKLETQNVKLYSANTIENEIENLVLNIKKDVFLNGDRFSDISVVMANPEYKEKLIKKFEENNISAFFDFDTPLIDNSYAKNVLNFISLLNNFSVVKFLSFIKNEYIDLERTIKNHFEIFLEKYSLLDKSELNEFSQYKNDIFYEDYLKVYREIYLKIKDFKDNFLKFDIYEFFDKIFEILNSFGLSKILKDKTEYYLTKDILKYKQFLQVEDKVNEIKKQITTYYNEELSLKKIENFLKICFENTVLSVPATQVDAVFVGDYKNSYFLECKNLYVLGADSQSFPALKSDISLFSDDELKKLEKTNEIRPKLIDTNKLLYFKAFNSILHFKNKITLSYSLTSVAGNKQFPSNIFKNFMNRILSLNSPIKVLKSDFENLEDFSKNEILNLLAFSINNKFDYLREYFKEENGIKRDVLYDILTNFYKIDGDKIKTDKNSGNFIENDKVLEKYIKINEFSASSLENYFACPNKFFFKNLLKLNKIEPLKMDARVLGNIVHSACYEFGVEILKIREENRQSSTEFSQSLNIKEENKEFGKENEIDYTKINQDEIINKVLNSEKYSLFKKLENSEEIISNLILEIKKLFDFIIKQQLNSDFKLNKAEFYFNFQDGGVKFKGFVDRIDENENEFIVIDYKTGNTKIEYKDIVFCKKIQLIIYAKILEKILNKKCAGIYYLSVNDDFSSKEKMKIYLNGITKNSNNNIHKLDNSALCGKNIESEFFEFKEKFVLSEKQFENLLDNVYQNVLDQIKQIKKGEFYSCPIILDKQSACDYCDYKEICKEKLEKKVVFSDAQLEKLLNDKNLNESEE